VASVSLHARILDAVQAKLITLIGATGLDGITSARVVQSWFPDVENLIKFEKLTGLPAVFVCPYGVEGMPANGGTNLADDITFNVPVAIAAAYDPDQTLYLDKYLRWREAAIEAFHNKRLTGVTESIRCVAMPGEIISVAAVSGAQYWSTTFRIAVTVRKARPA